MWYKCVKCGCKERDPDLKQKGDKRTCAAGKKQYDPMLAEKHKWVEIEGELT